MLALHNKLVLRLSNYLVVHFLHEGLFFILRFEHNHGNVLFQQESSKTNFSI